MIYRTEYQTNLIGKLTLASDGENIVGCWFDNDRLFGDTVPQPMEPAQLPVFDCAFEWLDRYFAGERPLPSELPLKANATPFRRQVWDILERIPYGETVTYGDIAAEIARKTGKKMSAQAVGGAVGHNPICVIVPCHRVMGAAGNLTGFGGGIDTKVKLLELEGVDMSTFFRPKKGTAL